MISVTINFSDQAYAALEDLKTRTGKPIAEVLRDAIALKTWFEDERAAGGHILIDDNHGIREVISV